MTVFWYTFADTPNLTQITCFLIILRTKRSRIFESLSPTNFIVFCRLFQAHTLTRNVPSPEACLFVAVFWPVSFVKWKCSAPLSFVVTICISSENTVVSKSATETWASTCLLASVMLNLATLLQLVNADHYQRQCVSTFSRSQRWLVPRKSSTNSKVSRKQGNS